MLLNKMYIEIFVFEDLIHDLTYVFEDDMYLQKIFDIYDMIYYELIHFHEYILLMNYYYLIFLYHMHYHIHLNN